MDELSADVMLPVVLSAPVNDTVSVDYVISGGTATQGEDYTATNGTVTFAAGQTESFVPLNITFDELEEVNETIVFALENAQNAELGTSVHSVTINADILPRLNLTLDQSQGPENEGTQIEVTINTAPSVDVTVEYTISGSAAAPADHDLASGVLTFPAGSSASQVLTLNVTDDPLDEDDETVVLELHNAINALLEGTVQRTHTIVDNDAPPNVGFTAGSTTAGENTSPEWPRVRLTAISGRVVTLNYTAWNGSANGGDYSVGGSGTITFQPGEQETSIPMGFTNDNADEPTQDFSISLSNLVNAGAGTLTHTVNIQDDDPTPTVGISTADTVQNEDATTVTLNVVLSNPSEFNVSVDFSAASGTTATGADFGYGTGSPLTFGGGTSATIRIDVREDSLDEFDELVRTLLSGPQNCTIPGATDEHWLTIGDEDSPPNLSFHASDVDVTENEGNPPPASRLERYRVVLSGASGKTINVPVTYAGTATGSDYSQGSNNLTFNPGSTEANIDLGITQDTTKENGAQQTETIIMTLGTPTNANLVSPSERTYTINDDD